MTDPTGTILDYIRNAYLSSSETLAPETSLFRDGLLDSMKLVELIAFVEETFKMRVSPMDITVDNFDTVNSIVSLITRKSGGNA